MEKLIHNFVWRRRNMTHLSNYIRAHRKATGLSQRDVARLLGGGNGSKVSGYEHFTRTPSLRTALKLQIIFERPIAEIFEGMFKDAEQSVGVSAKSSLTHLRPHATASLSVRHRHISRLAESLNRHEDVPF